GLEVAPVGGLRHGVAGCRPQDLLRADERDLERRRSRRRLRPLSEQVGRCRGEHGDGGERNEHETLHKAETPRVGRGCGLEEIAELEVQLPAWRGPAELVELIESVRVVDPERSEWRDDRGADPSAPERAWGVELGGPGPDVAGVE